MIRDEKEIKSLLEGVLAANPGKVMGISLSSSETGSTRFAENAITSSGVYNTCSLDIEVIKGKKRGVTSVNQLERDKIVEAVAKADALADVSPDNEELMPPLGPQKYPAVPPLYFPSTAECSPGRRVDAIASLIERAKKESLTGAGFFETTASFSAYMNSLGLYFFAPYSRAYMSNTLRSPAGGSGWAAAEEEDLDRIDIGALTTRAISKCLDSRQPRPLPAGKYTVILEPAAVADLAWYLLYNFTARDADEGTNFLSLPDGKNRLGQKLFSPKITIGSDPANPRVPSIPVGEDGMPRPKTTWIERGVIQNLVYSRFWAQKKGKTPTPFPANLIMEGGSSTLEEMIRSTSRGVLVSRFWYIRDLNPMILLLTGLTRDGIFLIEGGKVTQPVNNFRWNESPVNVFKNVEMMSRPERTVGGETGQSALVPALKVKEFNFSSVSEAV